MDIDIIRSLTMSLSILKHAPVKRYEDIHETWEFVLKFKRFRKTSTGYCETVMVGTDTDYTEALCNLYSLLFL